ncbi:AraC family transcriptional regulator [Halobacteriovorax sp. JY17]|uniref:AraC family transcriptional regulator n=1 Tax=Halobacteriovorax sp. JY17 TaxID=2014617 RepID=UPI000C3EE4D0|nr:AraC family transcriptional regulator [Halobacteriovorax sp. JY17]PIK13503.1 MAG: AraC family transcriptional regulator [Halobacteriovorax sp. JY17]
MDILSDILNHLDMKTSLYFRTDLTAPWGVNVPAYKNVARFHIVLSGSFWFSTEGQESFKVSPGDIILVPHGKEHTLRDNPKSDVHSLNDVIEGAEYKAGELLKYGEGTGSCTQLICGHFEFEEDNVHPFLTSFPSVIHIKKDGKHNFSWLGTALDFIDYESINREPGADSIINKLSEVTFIQALRSFMRENAVNTLFLSALNDKYIRKSIEEIHTNPGKKWKLEDLAKAAGLSRTVYAERFHKLTGTTPMNYVTQWRMEKAKKYLKDETLSVDQIAQEIGYAASESFQKSFKKIFGVTPSAYRKQYRQQ